MSIPVTINPGEQWKVVVQTHARDQLGLNIHYFRVVTVTGGVATTAAHLPAIDGNIAPVMTAAMSSTAFYRGTSFQKLTPLPRSDPAIVVVNAGAGTSGAQLLPTQVAGIWTKVTDNVGRSNRGRSYVPFPATTFLHATLGIPAAGYAGKLADIATFFSGLETFTVAGVALRIQWILKPQPVPKDVVDWRVLNQFATQRRRGMFGRTNP